MRAEWIYVNVTESPVVRLTEQETCLLVRFASHMGQTSAGLLKMFKILTIKSSVACQRPADYISLPNFPHYSWCRETFLVDNKLSECLCSSRKCPLIDRTCCSAFPTAFSAGTCDNLTVRCFNLRYRIFSKREGDNKWSKRVHFEWVKWDKVSSNCALPTDKK